MGAFLICGGGRERRRTRRRGGEVRGVWARARARGRQGQDLWEWVHGRVRHKAEHGGVMVVVVVVVVVWPSRRLHRDLPESWIHHETAILTPFFFGRRPCMPPGPPPRPQDALHVTRLRLCTPFSGTACVGWETKAPRVPSLLSASSSIKPGGNDQGRASTPFTIHHACRPHPPHDQAQAVASFSCTPSTP